MIAVSVLQCHRDGIFSKERAVCLDGFFRGRRFHSDEYEIEGLQIPGIGDSFYTGGTGGSVFFRDDDTVVIYGICVALRSNDTDEIVFFGKSGREERTDGAGSEYGNLDEKILLFVL